MSYIVFYKLENGSWRTYDGNNYDTYKIMPKIQCRFALMQYEESDEGLKEYHKTIGKWSEQIKRYMHITKFDYVNKFTDTIAIEQFFLLFCRKKILGHSRITDKESEYIEACYNAGLMYCKPTEGAIEIHSYDRIGFYQDVLGNQKYDFYIPDKEGAEIKLEKLPRRKKLKYGYYKVKITSEHVNARKVFSFNYDNVYNYYDLLFAMKYKKRLNFKIELVNDEYNAYVYESVVKCSDIFEKWNNTINAMKKKFTENKLLKNLGSKLWGVITQHQQICVNDTEIQKDFDKYKDYIIIRTVKQGEYGASDYQEYHYLQNTKEQPYKYNIRLKGWLNSYCRCQIAKHAMKDIDNVVRIHTDSIAFTKEQNIDPTLFKLEQKSSGLIRFKNTNTYYHKCKKCEQEFKYDVFKNHKC
jgi:hypothetical protein